MLTLPLLSILFRFVGSVAGAIDSVSNCAGKVELFIRIKIQDNIDCVIENNKPKLF